MFFHWFLGRAVSSGNIYVNPPLGTRCSLVLSHWNAGGRVRGRVRVSKRRGKALR